MRWITLALRIVLGAVFLYAAYTKLSQSWLLFAMAIDAYKVLPTWAVEVVARGLPWFELVLGLVLISGVALRYSAPVAAALLGVFFVMMLRSYGLGMGIDCGCFGLGEPISAKTLIRDGGLVAGAVALSWMAWRSARAPRITTAEAPFQAGTV
ncbi:MAG: MauE/DoxX family redox-associated membrane protein [Bryobacteraceae bacterium]